MQSPTGQPMVTFYVEVDDVEAALARAEALGGVTVLPRHPVPDGPAIGLFRDPQGNIIGLVEA
jgi:predicted enzyme related to lactoylglutathione lyase